MYIILGSSSSRSLHVIIMRTRCWGSWFFLRFLISDLPMMIDFQGLIIDRDNVMSKFWITWGTCLGVLFLPRLRFFANLNPYVDLRVFQMGSFGFDLSYDDTSSGFDSDVLRTDEVLQLTLNPRPILETWSSVGVIHRVPLNLTAPVFASSNP
jgi:hypothetical protein